MIEISQYPIKSLKIRFVGFLNQNEIDEAKEWENSLRKYLDKLIGDENDKIDVSQLRISFSTEVGVNRNIFAFLLMY